MCPVDDGVGYPRGKGDRRKQLLSVAVGCYELVSFCFGRISEFAFFLPLEFRLVLLSDAGWAKKKVYSWQGDYLECNNKVGLLIRFKCPE